MMQLKKWKEKAKSKKILLIGDALLDVYIQGEQKRFCREAPLPVFQTIAETYHGGGAANTAINLHALGAAPFFISIIGTDQNSMALIDQLHDLEIDTSAIIVQEGRALVTKKRFLADNTIVFRTDEGHCTPISAASAEKMIDQIEFYWERAELVLIVDYDTGMGTSIIIEALQKIQHIIPKKILIDAHHPEKYAALNPYLVKPNYKESIQVLSIKNEEGEHRIDQLQQNQSALHQALGTEIICQTIDKNGVLLFQKGKDTQTLYSTPIENHKSIGAGDTFMATLTLAIATGLTPERAIIIAHTAASVVLHKDKTAVCTADELWTQFNTSSKYHKDVHECKMLIEREKKLGKKIVFTNGCFDILHKGHIAFLEEAKKLGDLLIIAINDDLSIKQIKGENRPVNNLEDRIAVLSALTPVDHIISFNSITCEHLIYALKPAIFVKGSSYINLSIPETEAIKETGGKICILHSSSYSTSAIIDRIRHRV